MSNSQKQTPLPLWITIVAALTLALLFLWRDRAKSKHVLDQLAQTNEQLRSEGEA